MSMQKQIIVDADDLESRVAILEEGQLAELLVEREPRMVGSIYKARVVSVLPGMDAAFADIGLERNVFLSQDDVGFVSRDGVTVTPAPRSASIAKRLKENQQVVVQIVRAPVAGKGARATTRLALPGRYLVLLVAHGFQVGVSRKIDDRKERDRLRRIGDRIRPEDTGLIIRTEAEGRKQRDLEADLQVLVDLRDRLMATAGQTRAPALIHQDLTLTYQVIRDVFSDDVKALVIDEKGAYANALELVKIIAPHLRRRVKLYRKRMPIFQEYGVEDEIDRLLRRKVWLPSGGYVSIDQAEAFTAIDVNTGRYTGSKGLADTILRTNLEAADEIARQLRLRDVGGIIVVDFIDMDRARHRQRLKKAFEDALKRDRQKTKILHLSSLGLIEMTRKRRGESLMGILTETCPHCAGLGRVRKALTIALKIEREVSRLGVEGGAQAVIVRAAPAVADILISEDGARAMDLEKSMGGSLYIRADESLGPEEHVLTPMSRSDAAAAVKSYRKGSEVVLDIVEHPEPGGDGRAYGWADGYRVMVEGPRPRGERPAVVLTEAGRSFGRGHVKGAKAPTPGPAAAAEAGRGEPEAREAPSAARKRRRPRRKAKAAAEPSPPREEAAAKEPRRAQAAATPDQPRKEQRRRPRGRRRAKTAAAAPGPTAPVPSGEEKPKKEPASAPAEEAAPAAGPAAKPSAKKRRRGGAKRRRSAASSQREEPPPEPAAKGPSAESPAEGRPKRSGLLTRGSRRRKRSVR